MKIDIVWTDLSATAIAEALSELRGEGVSAYTAKQLLDQEGYGQRQAQKSQTMGEPPDRDAQFQRVAERVKVAAATVRGRMGSRRSCRAWRIGSGYRFGWFMIRRTRRSTIRSSIVCFRM